MIFSRCVELDAGQTLLLLVPDERLSTSRSPVSWEKNSKNLFSYTPNPDTRILASPPEIVHALLSPSFQALAVRLEESGDDNAV